MDGLMVSHGKLKIQLPATTYVRATVLNQPLRAKFSTPHSKIFKTAAKPLEIDTDVIVLKLYSFFVMVRAVSIV